VTLPLLLTREQQFPIDRYSLPTLPVDIIEEGSTNEIKTIYEAAEMNLLSIREAAQKLGISRHTLYAWSSKRLIAFIKIGDRTMFDPAEIEEFINKGRVKPTLH
jgi:excisionase family DNA binding protein